MSAHRTDPGYAGWGWDDIVQKVETEAGRRAAAAESEVEATFWLGRIEPAARLIDALVEGCCMGEVYPTLLLDHLPDFVARCLDAVGRVREDARIAAVYDATLHVASR